MASNRVMLTEDQILAIAHTQSFYVQRFGTRHEKLRKLTRRMQKDGKLTLVNRTSHGFNYTTRAPLGYGLAERLEIFELTPDPLCPEDM